MRFRTVYISGAISNTIPFEFKASANERLQSSIKGLITEKNVNMTDVVFVKEYNSKNWLKDTPVSLELSKRLFTDTDIFT